jgi:nucleotidyltransferase/DNA polymerase involved in DNA repair
MEKYVAVSREIREIFHRVTPLVEPMSIDEAFLDVSECLADREALDLAQELKKQIRNEEGLTASIGIAPSKFVAKIASDLEKPDGLVQVLPHQVQDFLAPLPISRLWGVGPKTEERLTRMSVRSIGDLRKFEKNYLHDHLGKLGDHLWLLARGIDNRSVKTSHIAKSVSQERTFGEDTRDPKQLIDVLRKLSGKVSERMKKYGLCGKTVKLKLRYSDFTTLSRQTSFREPVADFDEIYPAARSLLVANWDRKLKIRLIGVGVSSMEKPGNSKQLKLFE